MLFDRAGENLGSCWEVGQSDKCHSPRGEIIWTAEHIPDCFIGSREVGRHGAPVRKLGGGDGPGPPGGNDTIPPTSLSPPALCWPLQGEWCLGALRGDFLDVLLL